MSNTTTKRQSAGKGRTLPNATKGSYPALWNDGQGVSYPTATNVNTKQKSAWNQRFDQTKGAVYSGRGDAAWGGYNKPVGMNAKKSHI